MARGDIPAEVQQLRRRALLGGTAAGASALVAGCSGGGGDGGGGDTTQPPAGTDTTGTTETGDGDKTTQGTQTETTTQGPPAHVSGQTLTWYTMQNPAEFTWLNTIWPRPPTIGKYISSHDGMTMTMQLGVWGPWTNRPVWTGDPIWEHYEGMDITPGTVTVKIRDDARWSNGDPITAPDALCRFLAHRMGHAQTAPYELGKYPVVPLFATTDYEIVDDKTYKLFSEPELYDTFPDTHIWYELTWAGRGGVNYNTKIEPYDERWNLVSDWWDQWKNGEIDPWNDEGWSINTELPKAQLGPYGWSPKEEKNNYDFHWEKHFRDPANVVTTGAWTLKAINGTQSVTLQPNPEHYAAEWVNFDEVEIVARPSVRANRTAIKANKQDYFTGDVPAYIADSFPDNISERQVPANGGIGFGPNHRYELFSDRRARQAIMYAVDKERMAKSVHRTKFKVVKRPGGNAWDAPQVMGEDWISNNLQSYERDLDRAKSLMQEAGFHKGGGNWVNDSGEPLSITIPTSRGTPTLTPAFANQLSQFGIDTSLQTYSGSVFSEKKNNGGFNVWRSGWANGFAWKADGFPWHLATIWEHAARNLLRIFPKEQVDEVFPMEQYGKVGPFTLEAPPIGEPDGELKTWHPGLIGLRVVYPTSLENWKQKVREAAWLINWHMPMFPIADDRNQQFLDTGHWNWPAEDSKYWNGVGVSGLQPEEVVSFGQYIHANPDNPESGASVDG